MIRYEHKSDTALLGNGDGQNERPSDRRAYREVTLTATHKRSLHMCRCKIFGGLGLELTIFREGDFCDRDLMLI